MKLNDCLINEIEFRTTFIRTILEKDEPDKDIQLHNQLFLLKAVVDQWEFTTELDLKDKKLQKNWEPIQ